MERKLAETTKSYLWEGSNSLKMKRFQTRSVCQQMWRLFLPSSLLFHFMGSRYRFQSTTDVGISEKTWITHEQQFRAEPDVSLKNVFRTSTCGILLITWLAVLRMWQQHRWCQRPIERDILWRNKARKRQIEREADRGENSRRQLIVRHLPPMAALAWTRDWERKPHRLKRLCNSNGTAGWTEVIPGCVGECVCVCVCVLAKQKWWPRYFCGPEVPQGTFY